MYVGRNRGIPDELMRQNNHAMCIDTQSLLPTSDAVYQFESHGGHLTIFNEFGCDPLKDRDDLCSQRELEFQTRYPDFEQFFHTTVNGINSTFRLGLIFFIEVSKGLLSQL